MRVPFEIVDAQVETLYSSGLGEEEQLDDRLLAIEEFVEACGWTVDEYEMRREFGELN